ncbi:VOC family protein [Pseudorhodoferax sp.]|uniref:VOC family protein n=1 Tax=Pseudorhodoferax sp. TaxID=1993553 RepID=UPI002DD6B299|nr:VOC family protein [Pseudorhodoferax sp.]
MIGYVTLGTNAFPRAAAFYDALLAELGAKRFMDTESFVMWTSQPGKPGICLVKPFDKQPASVGNGTMVALIVDSREKVDAVHRKAMALGATDEGAPGLRGKGFYAAYFRDLDGNKLNVFHMGA